MSRIALATCAALPDGDEDFPSLVQALATRGVEAVVAVWDDAAVAWASFDQVVVRCTWDYTRAYDRFLSWVRHVDAVSRLVNPAVVVRWNTDKRYLRSLQAVGVPVVPTRWIEPGAPLDLPEESSLVVKPVISAGARDTARYAAGDPGAAEHARALRDAGRTVMVQPYLDAVDTHGETALVYLGGVYSHAVRKGPILRTRQAPTQKLFAEEDIRARQPQPAERAVADRVLAYVRERFGAPVYARVDLVPGADGEPLLLELELTEPSLFLAYGVGAAERFAAALQ